MRTTPLLLSLIACSGSPAPAPAPPSPPPAPDAAAARPEPDAAIDAELLAAPASVFRFHAEGAAPRLETWTLRRAGGRAQIVVEHVTPAPAVTTTYTGAAREDGATLVLDVVAGSGRLALACTPETLAAAAPTAVRTPSARKPKGGTCDPGRWVPAQTTKLEVLACKVPGFDAPMPFAAAPGIEYAFVDDGCALRGGDYRAIAADGAVAPVR